MPIGHTNAVRSVNFSADGKKIISTGHDVTVKTWDVATGRLLTDFSPHREAIEYAEFSPDGRQIATASFEGSSKILDTKTGNVLHTLQSSKPIYVTRFSPDGNILATGANDSCIYLWDAGTGKKIRTIKDDRQISWVEFSHDGKLLLSSSWDSVRLWDVKTGNPLAFSTDGGMESHATFSADDQYIAIANGSLRVFQRGTGKLIFYVDSEEITRSAFSKDGKRILTVSPSWLKVWDLATGIPLLTMQGHKDVIYDAKFSPDNRSIASGSEDATVRIWDAYTGNLVSVLEGKAIAIEHAAFHPNGKNVIVPASNGSFMVWNTEEGKPEQQVEAHEGWITAVDISDDGKHLATASADNTAAVWDLETRTLIARMKGHEAYLTSVDLNADASEMLTSCSDGAVILWEAATGKELQRFIGHTNDVKQARFHPGSKMVATVSEDKTLRLWNLSGKELANISHPDYVTSIAFNRDGSRIATTCEDNKVRVFDTENRKLLVTISGYALPVRSVEFDPTGKKLLVSSWDRTARIWDLETMDLLQTLEGHSGWVIGASYNKTGDRIITTSVDRTNKLWDANTGQLIQTFFALTPTEYFVQLPNRYYKGTREVVKMLHYVTPEQEVIGFDQLDIQYNRPDKVLAAIGNGDEALIGPYFAAYQKRIKKLGIDTLAFTTAISLPRTEISGRNNISYEQKGNLLQLKITASDPNTLLDRFNVWVNEVPVFGMKGVSLRTKYINRFDTTVSLTLAPGENVIETSVINAAGMESYRLPLHVNFVPAIQPKEKLYFIGIGIDHFRQPGYDLNWSVKDIRDLAASLKTTFGNDVVIDTLFDNRVSRENVVALKKRLQQATVNDKVIVSYSGHGLLSKDFDYYLSTYPVNFEKPEENGLPYEVLEGLLDGIAPRKKLMLIDACHSGEVDKEEMEKYVLAEKSLEDSGTKSSRKPVPADGKLGMKNSFELMQELFVNVGRSTGATIISAAAGTQFAQEKADLQNGVFTYSILEYMKNHPRATVTELRNYVNKRVTELTNGMQVPTTRSETKAVDWYVW